MKFNTFEELGINTGKSTRNKQRHDCPECDGHKTLSVTLDTGLFFCFRCEIKGRVGGSSWQRKAVQAFGAARANDHETTATQAAAMWKNTSRCYWHPYLRDKAVLPLGIRMSGTFLVVPMYDTAGRLWNTHTIAPDGTKRFMKGGRVTGCHYPIASDDGPIYVAEGFATGAALHMYVKRHARIAVAFNAGNLKPVALSLRQANPDTDIIIAADNDAWKPHVGNVGLMKGREAAAAVHGSLIYPRFDGLDVSSQPTDFCDLHILERGHAHGC